MTSDTVPLASSTDDVDVVDNLTVEQSSPRAHADPPRWLLFVALGLAAGVLCFGLVGLVLAINQVFRPALAFPLAAVAWVLVMWLARPVYANAAPSTRRSHVVAAVALALVGMITLWNGAHASQHIALNRDGGAYANEGRWIARSGNLEVRPHVGPFAQDHSLVFFSYAVYDMPDGSIQFQFSHLLPVVLAGAFNIGGNTGLFHMPELLGGIALLAFFVLAWRLFRRPLFALSAMLALAFIIPQVSFSRDTYSEIPSQVLLFTAIWLLVSKKVLPSWRIAMVAGLFLGAMQATRIDALIFFAGVPPIFALAWLRAAREERRRVLLSIGAFAVGVAPGMVIGFIDLMNHSGYYYRDLAMDVHKLERAFALSAAVSLVVVVLWRFVWPLAKKLSWTVIGNVVAGLVIVAGFGAWILRPHLQTARGGLQGLTYSLQQSEHQVIDATRTYSERSISWMGWYLGPITVAVAIIALALLLRAFLVGRYVRTFAALALLAPGTALYLYKPDAAPDHVWVDRRFLSTAFPTLILLAVGLAAAVFFVKSAGHWQTALRVGAVVVAVGAFAYPLYTTEPVQAMTEQRGWLQVIEQSCGMMGNHAALVVLEHDHKDLFDDWMPQGFRSWCGADVAIMRSPVNGNELRELARQWEAEGRTMYVAAASPDTISTALPDAQIQQTVNAVNNHFLTRTLTRRPHQYNGESFSIAVARVPTT
jgi:hypothetical protein